MAVAMTHEELAKENITQLSKGVRDALWDRHKAFVALRSAQRQLHEADKSWRESCEVVTARQEALLSALTPDEAKEDWKS